jgi:hypothetical protein
MNATQAGWMCKHGSDFYRTKTTKPNNTPLSGNVIVTMTFLIDA